MRQKSGPAREPAPVMDTYATSLARIERAGPCVRLTFAVIQIANYGECGIPDSDPKTENIVIAKVIVPAQSLAQLVDQLLAAPATLEQSQPPAPKLLR